MWLYQNEKLIKDGQSLCVSPELKLVEGESYRKNESFKIIRCENCEGVGYWFTYDEIRNTCVVCKGNGQFAIPIEPQGEEAEEPKQTKTMSQIPEHTAINLLKELCQLKHYKEEVGKDEFYEKRQPELWKEANEFLNSVKEVDQGIAMTGDFKKEAIEIIERFCNWWDNGGARMHEGIDMEEWVCDAQDFIRGIRVATPDPTDKTEGEAIEILKNLCQLKHHKDEVGKDDFYEREQPLAWKRANEFLNSLPSPPEGEQK